MPVGFKWFVDGLLDGSLGFVGEESAGASFLRKDGSVWTTDKDGIVPALLSAEITARTGRDPGRGYRELTQRLRRAGVRAHRRAGDAGAEEVVRRSSSPNRSSRRNWRARRSSAILTRAPGNDAAIGGLKVVAESGWFAARPSGTEDVYKIYAESYRSADHLKRIQAEAQSIVTAAIA